MSAEAHHAEPGFFRKYLFSTDHKMIAMQYLFTGMIMAVIGGYLAYVFRMQLAYPAHKCPATEWFHRTNTIRWSPCTARS